MKIFLFRVSFVDGCYIKFTLKCENLISVVNKVLSFFNQEQLEEIMVKEVDSKEADSNEIKSILNSIYGLKVFDTDSIQD